MHTAKHEPLITVGSFSTIMQFMGVVYLNENSLWGKLLTIKDRFILCNFKCKFLNSVFDTSITIRSIEYGCHILVLKRTWTIFPKMVIHTETVWMD